MPKKPKSIAERGQVIDLLILYSDWLMDKGYIDTDWFSEPPFAIYEFMKFYDKFNGIRKK